MHKILLFTALLGSSFKSHAETVYQYESKTGDTILTVKKRTNDPSLKLVKETKLDAPKAKATIVHLTEQDIEKEEIKNYYLQYKEWLGKGGKNSGLRPPVKPARIYQELAFWPILHGNVWIGGGLVKSDSIRIKDGFESYEDCMANKSDYIRIFSKDLDLYIPQNVKLPKAPKVTYSITCYSTISNVERTLVP